MSIKTEATKLCNSTWIHMLLALLMTNCLSSCGIGLTESVKISRNKKLTRPETTIPQGHIRGINMFTQYKRPVSGFLGIPYAQPPVGDLRFEAPLPAGSWDGTLDASTDTYSCVQFDDQDNIAGDEDCLYHNVFTPLLPTCDDSALLPVMVYILGGGFKTVNNSIARFGPDFLLDKDVVLLIPNVRQGVFGYLSTEDDVAPGNYGLKDIVLCLEWVRDNIKYFGGDPNQVTLFGGSSGAIAVDLVVLSKLTDGLFHRYITQSGSAFSNSVNQKRWTHRNQAFQLGKYLGCPTDTSRRLVNCLRSFNASQLLDTRSIFYAWRTYPANLWCPSIEPDLEGALLTDTPANLYTAGETHHLPWIASTTRDEGITHIIAFSENPELFEDFLDNIDLALPHMIDYQHVVDDVTAYTEALKSYYLNDLTADRSILLANLSKLLGDGLFGYPVYRAVRLRHLLAESPQYFGSFQYRGTFSFTYFYSHADYKAVAHGDELLYLFGHQGERLGPAGREYSETDHFMIDTMTSLWTSFATHGHPTTPDSISTTIWEPYSSRNNYLRIGNEHDTALEMQYDLNLERMQFWEELGRATAKSGESRNPFQVLSFAICLAILLYVDRFLADMRYCN